MNICLSAFFVFMNLLFTLFITFFVSLSGFRSNELGNQRVYNASMSEQSVQTLFNSLTNNQSETFLNNYSTVYFSHLNDNFPINSHGTCSYVGISMLLSFFDSYWDDEFVAEFFEETASFTSTNSTNQNLDIPPVNTESPGIISEDWNDVENLTLSQYLDFVLTNEETYLQSYLIKLSYDMFDRYCFDSTTNPYGLTLYEQTHLLLYYLTYKVRLHNSQAFVTCSTNYDQDDLEEYITTRLIDGVPVMINALTSVGYHSVVAYDYDSSSETIYVHTGWKDTNGNALTHISLSQLGITLSSIDSAVSIDATSGYHGCHCDNYVSSTNSSYCSCQMVYPRNIQMTSGNYLDISPVINWDSLYEEKWYNFYEYNPYIELSILNHNQATMFVKSIYFGNEYALTEDEWFEINFRDQFSDYYVKLVLRSSTYNFPINYCLKSFNKPSQYLNAKTILPSPNYYTGYTDYYEDSVNARDNFVTHATQTGLVFKTRRFRAGYIHNECIVLSPKRLGYQEAFIEYQFVIPVNRIDIELSHWREISHEGLDSSTGKAVIETYRSGEYDVDNPSLDLLSLSTALPESRNNKRTYKLCFDKPISRFRIYAKTNDANLNNDNRGRICIGKISVYESPLYQAQFDLPTNGSELEYDENNWNKGRYYKWNCYNYALNNSIYDFMQPGERGCYFNYLETYNSFIDDVTNDYIDSFYSKTALELLVGLDSLYMQYEHDNQTIVGFEWGPISEYETCPQGTYKVALVLDLESDDKDFHWYRQNDDGTWSHKPADGKVENWDYNGNPIYNPKYCDRRDAYTGHNYSTFVGFYYVSSVIYE